MNYTHRGGLISKSDLRFGRWPKKGKISERQLLDEWTKYQSALVWDETLVGPVEIGGEVIDVKDTPYIALERKLCAHGILTRDSDIQKMGGHPLSNNFVMSARAYARAIAESGSIRASGTAATLFAFKAVQGVVNVVVKFVKSLPPIVKVLAVLLVVVAALHPTSRRKARELLKQLGVAAGSLFSEINSALAAAAELDRTAQSKAAIHLKEASQSVRQTALTAKAWSTKKPPLLPKRRKKSFVRRRMVAVV